MSVAVAEWIVRIAVAYAGVGFVFALAFAWRGAGRVDAAARAGTWGFRLLILPGAAVLWPLLARRWLGGTALPPAEHNAHRDTTATGEPTN